MCICHNARAVIDLINELYRNEHKHRKIDIGGPWKTTLDGDSNMLLLYWPSSKRSLLVCSPLRKYCPKVT